MFAFMYCLNLHLEHLCAMGCFVRSGMGMCTKGIRAYVSVQRMEEKGPATA